MNTIKVEGLKKFSPSNPAPFGYFAGSISKRTQEAKITRFYQDGIVPKFIGGKWFYDIIINRKVNEELKSRTGASAYYTLDSNGDVISSIFSENFVFFTVILDRDFKEGDQINIELDPITLLAMLL